MDLVDNKREILITIDVLKKVVVKQSKKLRDLRAEYRTLVEVSRKIAEYHAPTAFPSQYPNEDELWKEFLSAIPPSDEQKEGKRDGKNND